MEKNTISQQTDCKRTSVAGGVTPAKAGKRKPAAVPRVPCAVHLRYICPQITSPMAWRLSGLG